MELDLEQYRIIVESSPNMIWRSGPDGKCDYFNDTWLKFTGRTMQEEVGDGWAKGVHPEDLARCLEDYLQAFGERHPFVLTYRLRRHDGVFRWVTDTGVPFWTGETFLGFIGSCVDVTEVRRLDVLRDEFIGTASHELRDPLAVIRVLAQCGLMEAGQDGVADYFRRIMAKVDFMAALISEMLVSTHLDTGKSVLNLKEVQLSDLLSRDEAHLREICCDQSLRFDLSGLPQPEPAIWVDPEKISQVLENLTSNAAKYSPEGSAITVGARGCPEGIEVWVKDAGFGVDGADRELIFEKFFRGQNAVNLDVRGLGLGLYIAKQVLELHGGRIWHENNPEGGSTFRLFLLAVSPAESRAPSD